jgi:hypothetical protein
MSRCPLLIRHIRNGYQTMTVTTTSHQSREMAVTLGSQGSLVTGTKAQLVTVAQYRNTCCAPASPLCWWIETRLFHACLSTYRIHNEHQTMTVTTTSHQSREMTISLGPHRTLVTDTKTKLVTVAQYRRRLLCSCVSTILMNWDASTSRTSQYI